MMDRVGRFLARVLIAASAVGLGACSFDSLGSGAATGMPAGTTTEATSTGVTPADSSSGAHESSEASTHAHDVTSDSTAAEPSGSSTDTGEPPPAFPSGPFGRPVPVDVVNINGLNEDDPALSPDGLELYFETDRGGLAKIWVARRESLNAQWEEPTIVPGIGSEFGADGGPGLSHDGRFMFFISNRPGSVGNDIYVTQRERPGMPWLGPTRVDALSSGAEDVGPRPVPGDDGIFVCSNRIQADSVGDNDLYLSETADFAAGTYSTPIVVAELSSPQYDCMLMMANSRLEVFFDSSRAPTMGLQDIWSATRVHEDDELGEPFSVAELNSIAEDRDPFLSADGHELYFATNRAGNFDIWVARR